jgi:hypothetical protein
MAVFDPTQPFGTFTARLTHKAPRFDPTQPFETATVPPPEQASEGLLQEIAEGASHLAQ